MHKCICWTHAELSMLKSHGDKAPSKSKQHNKHTHNIRKKKKQFPVCMYVCNVVNVNCDSDGDCHCIIITVCHIYKHAIGDSNILWQLQFLLFCFFFLCRSFCFTVFRTFLMMQFIHTFILCYLLLYRQLLLCMSLHCFDYYNW